MAADVLTGSSGGPVPGNLVSGGPGDVLDTLRDRQSDESLLETA